LPAPVERLYLQLLPTLTHNILYFVLRLRVQFPRIAAKITFSTILKIQFSLPEYVSLTASVKVQYPP
jgi:hypothetical protein